MQWHRKEPKTFEDIQNEFSAQERTEREKLGAELGTAISELDRVGIDLLRLDDPLHLHIRSHEREFRVYVRKRVFSVQDVELRRPIMSAIDNVRHKDHDRAWGLSLLGKNFADRLRYERRQVPQPSWVRFGTSFAILVIAYWFGGSSLSYAIWGVGFAVLLACIAVAEHIGTLQRYDVTMQDGIAYVERYTAVWMREEERLLPFINLFSEHERSTGEPDAVGPIHPGGMRD